MSAGYYAFWLTSSLVDAEEWPVYEVEGSKNFVLEQNRTSHAEPDLYRAEGMQYISGIILANRG